MIRRQLHAIDLGAIDGERASPERSLFVVLTVLVSALTSMLLILGIVVWLGQPG